MRANPGGEDGPECGGGIVVFLGPSLPLPDARSVLPDATYLPPVAQGDVATIVSRGAGSQPRAVGIIDGVFYQSLPIWHKEILYALEQGVAVFGASSMGAIRAAECDVYGMVGVGEVYRRYSSGELTDDDEVALTHDGAENGWVGRSEPLVNIRATLEAAVASDLIMAELADRTVAAAKELWFPDRTMERIIEAARESGVSTGEGAILEDVLREHYVDIKRLDALDLLETLRSVDMPGTPSFDRVDSGLFKSLWARDRKVVRGGVPVRREEIARHAALCYPGFAEMRDRAIDRLLVMELAKLWHVEASDEEIAAEAGRMRTRLRITDDAQYAQWLHVNDWRAEDFGECAAGEAVARKLRDWRRIKQRKQLLVEPILNELRLRGEYEEYASGAALHSQRLADLSEGTRQADPTPPPSASELVFHQVRDRGWRPDVPAEQFAEEACLAGTEDLLAELEGYWSVSGEHRSAVDLLYSLIDDPTPEGSEERSPEES